MMHAHDQVTVSQEALQAANIPAATLSTILDPDDKFSCLHPASRFRLISLYHNHLRREAHIIHLRAGALPRPCLRRACQRDGTAR